MTREGNAVRRLVEDDKLLSAMLAGRGIEQGQLVKALAGAKGPGAETAEFLLANMSQRMATNLREEMAAVGRLKDKDVEAAQTALVLAIRDLVDTGELVMIVDEEDEE